jgi:hypothetical protein
MDWVSIKDALPALDTEVLVFTRTKKWKYAGATHIQVAKMYKVLSCGCEEQYTDDTPRWTCMEDVLFWMPLPEGPDYKE